MTDAQQIVDVATKIADAIGGKDVTTLSALLAPTFLLRKPGEDGQNAEAFLSGVGQIPGEILFVKVVSLTLDVAGESAVATGVQHAQVRIDGNVVDDKRPFVDWFVKIEGEWRLRLAVDLPQAPEQG